MIEIYYGAHPNRATLLADYSSLLAALSDAKLTKVRDALPPARDLFGDEGAAAFLQTEQSYNVQLPSSASSMGSSPCESRGSSSGLQHRLATQRRPLTGPALGQSTRARPTSTLCTASRLALVRRAVRRDLRLELPLAAPKPLLSHTLGTGFERPALQSPFTLACASWGEHLGAGLLAGIAASSCPHISVQVV